MNGRSGWGDHELDTDVVDAGCYRHRIPNHALKTFRAFEVENGCDAAVHGLANMCPLWGVESAAAETGDRRGCQLNHFWSAIEAIDAVLDGLLTIFIKEEWLHNNACIYEALIHV